MTIPKEFPKGINIDFKSFGITKIQRLGNLNDLHTFKFYS